MLDVREKPTFEEGASLGVAVVPIPADGAAEGSVEVAGPDKLTVAYAIAVE